MDEQGNVAGGDYVFDDPKDERMRSYLGILSDAWDLFERKSKDYTNSGGQVFEDSGLMGQFMKMRDKISKLKKPLWDAEILRQAQQIRNVPPREATAEDVAILSEIDLEFEGAEEIMMDLIGHCLLGISVLRGRKVGIPAHAVAPASPENDPFDLEDTPTRKFDIDNIPINLQGNYSEGVCAEKKVGLNGYETYCRLWKNHRDRQHRGRGLNGEEVSWKVAL